MNQLGGLQIKGNGSNSINISGCYFERNRNYNISVGVTSIYSVGSVSINNCFFNSGLVTDNSIIINDCLFAYINNNTFINNNTLTCKVYKQMNLVWESNTFDKPVEMYDGVQYTNGYKYIFTGTNGSVYIKKDIYDVLNITTSPISPAEKVRGALYIKDISKTDSISGIVKHQSGTYKETAIKNSFYNITSVNFTGVSQVVITALQYNQDVLNVINTSNDTSILILPDEIGRNYIIRNKTNYAINVKRNNGIAVQIQSNTIKQVCHTGTDYELIN